RLRQLDALPHPRRDAGAGPDGDRLVESPRQGESTRQGEAPPGPVMKRPEARMEPRPPELPMEGVRRDEDRSARGEGAVPGRGVLPVGPRRRALVRLYLRDRQLQRGALDPAIRRAIPADLGARPGPGARGPLLQ